MRWLSSCRVRWWDKVVSPVESQSHGSDHALHSALSNWAKPAYISVKKAFLNTASVCERLIALHMKTRGIHFLLPDLLSTNVGFNYSTLKQFSMDISIHLRIEFQKYPLKLIEKSDVSTISRKCKASLTRGPTWPSERENPEPLFMNWIRSAAMNLSLDRC